jgi:hypothetical protein
MKNGQTLAGYGDLPLVETTDGSDVMNHQKHFSGAYI